MVRPPEPLSVPELSSTGFFSPPFAPPGPAAPPVLIRPVPVENADRTTDNGRATFDLILDAYTSGNMKDVVDDMMDTGDMGYLDPSGTTVHRRP
jgi:hypothetical protein